MKQVNQLPQKISLAMHWIGTAILIFTAGCNTTASGQESIRKLIGTYKNGTITLSIDTAEALRSYNDNLLKQSRINGRFTGLNVVEKDKNYYLVFEGAEYKSTFSLSIEGSDVYAMVNISCTTSECASERFGCTPDEYDSACRSCSNDGACTKTVSSVALF